MVIGALMFALMGLCIKFAAKGYHALEITAYRGLIGALFVLGVARIQGVSLRTRLPLMHLRRSSIGTASMIAWFFAITQLPLATAMTLNYMSSIWVATFLIGGALLLNHPATDQRQGPLLATVLTGFGGVALMLRPTFDNEQLLAGLMGLASSLLAALAYLQVTALSRAGEPEARTVFYFSASASLAGMAGTLYLGASPWDWQACWWLIPTGVCAALGQLCMTRAYASGSTLLVANLQYTGIVFSSLFGLLIFGDLLPWEGWAGMALIVASAIAASVLRTRAAPGSPAPEQD
jgi:drug/metabolite transporter (DMT)-like permease